MNSGKLWALGLFPIRLILGIIFTLSAIFWWRGVEGIEALLGKLMDPFDTHEWTDMELKHLWHWVLKGTQRL